VTDFATDAEERLGGRVFHVRSDAHEQLQRRTEALGVARAGSGWSQSG
jgi:hypothetical protein